MEDDILLCRAQTRFALIIELPRSAEAVDLLLLDEPDDVSDIRDVRHWIRVYSNLMQLAGDLPTQEAQAPSLGRRLSSWQARLAFWQRRAHEIANPPVARA